MADTARSRSGRWRSKNGCGTSDCSLDVRRAVALSGLIVIDGDAVGDRVALASEHEAARDLVVFEGEVYVHIDFARDDLGATGGTNAALARIRQLDAVEERAVDDALPRAVKRERLGRAVDDRGDLRLRVSRLD